MEFTSKCKKCDGTGKQTITMVDFVRVAYNAVGEMDNRFAAMRDVRLLAQTCNLPSGSEECKLFVEALQNFRCESDLLLFVEALQDFERYLRSEVNFGA